MMLTAEALQQVWDKYGAPVEDQVTGYALNIPLCLQTVDFRPGDPGYAEFVERRNAAGFTVDDTDTNL